MTDKDLMQQRRSQVFRDYDAGRFATVTALCEHYQVSRTWFYRWLKRWDAAGPAGMRSRKPGPQTSPQALGAAARQALLDYVEAHPAHGAHRIAAHVGVEVSAMTVQRYLQQWDLGTRQQRMHYHRCRSGAILTEAELSAWAQDRAASQHRHIAVDTPGELVGLDVFYLGTLKGIGRIYQFTAIDCYSGYGWAALYDAKTAANAVAFLEEHVLPTFAGHRALQRVLHDNGKEFTTHWETDNHRFTRTLQAYGITQTTTQVRHPWTNGHVERFQQTLLHECYQRTLQETIYPSIAALQRDVDRYLQVYNWSRAHQGARQAGDVPAALFYGGAFPTALPAA